MKTLLISLLLFQVTTILFQAQLLQAKKCTFTSKYQIRVKNALPVNVIPDPSKASNAITVCCKSGDDYIGRFILYENQQLTWSFCNNLFGRTVFYCNIIWGSKAKRLDVFNRDLSKRCKSNVCLWAAISDGIYFTGDAKEINLKKEYDWDDQRNVNLSCWGFGATGGPTPNLI